MSHYDLLLTRLSRASPRWRRAWLDTTEPLIHDQWKLCNARQSRSRGRAFFAHRRAELTSANQRRLAIRSFVGFDENLPHTESRALPKG